MLSTKTYCTRQLFKISSREDQNSNGRKIGSRAHIDGARVFCHIRFIHGGGAPMELITGPHVQSVSKATTKSPQLRSELGRAGVWVQSTAIHYLFLLGVITLDTRPPSSQYVNQCTPQCSDPNGTEVQLVEGAGPLSEPVEPAGTPAAASLPQKGHG